MGHLNTIHDYSSTVKTQDIVCLHPSLKQTLIFYCMNKARSLYYIDPPYNYCGSHLPLVTTNRSFDKEGYFDVNVYRKMETFQPEEIEEPSQSIFRTITDIANSLY